MRHLVPRASSCSISERIGRAARKREALGAQLQALLRRLADMETGESPVLSINLDMRLQVTGANPALRSFSRTL